MSSLSNADRIRLEKFLGMESGYVCDFSDRTFRDFVLESADVDVYLPEYEIGGTSKANRLRTFWKRESDTLVVQLLGELIEYWKTKKVIGSGGLTPSEQALYTECLMILAKLNGTSDEPIIEQDEILKLRKKIIEIHALKEAVPWGGEYKVWEDLTEKLVKELFGEDGLKIFQQQKSVVATKDGFIYELCERKKILEGLINNQEEYHMKSQKAAVTGSHQGIFIAARKIENNGLISGPRVEVVTDDYSGTGSISTSDTLPKKEQKVHPIERLTNNQTFAIIIGGLILLVILYFIFHFSGINLSQFR